MDSIPTWLRPQKDLGARIQNTTTKRRRKRSVARRAMGEITGFVAHMLCHEEEAAASGLLQRIDPRAKVIGLTGLVVVVTLLESIAMIALALAASLALAWASKVRVKSLGGAWISAPLFSAAIAIPATLNMVTDGSHIWTLAHFSPKNFGPWHLPETLAVTREGVYIASRFVLRVTTCVSLALLLSMTTSPTRLFRGLRALGVPKIFVMLLNIMQRYLDVIAKSAEEIHLAKISRSVRATSIRREQAWVAAGMGSLFRRTQALGNQVYNAMISRGYTGEVYLLDEPKWSLKDWGFLFCSAAFGAMLLMLA